MKRILSIDGGGIRGVIPARILQYLEERIGPCSKAFDLIAGTSTGGILAAGLAHPNPFAASDLVSLYVNDGPAIFHRSWWEPISLLEVKYPAAQIESVLQKYYGLTKLSESLTDVLITSCDQGKIDARFFKSRLAKTNPAEDVPLWYAARATSAAPTYFPNIDNLVDGGMLGATNPAMLALTEARIAWPGEPLSLLSIGTGSKDVSVNGHKSEHWGELEYLSAIIEMLLDAPAKVVDRMAKESLPVGCYVRIQGQFSGPVPRQAMDAASPENIKALIQFGCLMIEDNKAVLDGWGK